MDLHNVKKANIKGICRVCNKGGASYECWVCYYEKTLSKRCLIHKECGAMHMEESDT